MDIRKLNEINDRWGEELVSRSTYAMYIQHHPEDVPSLDAFLSYYDQVADLMEAVDHDLSKGHHEKIGKGCTFFAGADFETAARPEHFTPPERFTIDMTIRLDVHRSAVGPKNALAAAAALRRVADRLERAGREVMRRKAVRS